MKQLSLLCILALALLLTVGCDRPQADGGNRPEGFFDLGDYMNQQVELLSQQPLRIRKTIAYNDVPEAAERDTLNVRQELNIFSGSNINRPALYDRYSVDSVYAGASLQQLVYQALDDEVSVKRMTVSYDDNGEVSRIDLERITDNYIYEAQQSLSYIPGYGYRIETYQDAILSAPLRFSVDVSFLP